MNPKVSPEERAGALAALKALFDEPSPTPSHDTRKTENEEAKLKKQNRATFDKRIGYRVPSSELAEKIAAAEAVVWIPHAYVLFVRHATCRHCTEVSHCMDIPRLFLQQRKQRPDESNPYFYTPVKSIEYPKLPRRKVVNVVTTPFCLRCFENPISCESSLLSEQVDTQLQIEELEKLSPQSRAELLSGEASQFLSTPLSQQKPLAGGFAGSPSEMEFGSVCGEREFAQHATVEG